MSGDITLITNVVIEISVECKDCSCIETYRMHVDDAGMGSAMKFIDEIYDAWGRKGCPTCTGMPDRITDG